MTMVIAPQLETPIDIGRAMRMAAIHDLGEVYAGDHHAFNARPTNHQENERAGLAKIVRRLPDTIGSDILALWEEFEAGETPEARLVKALDKVEVLIQHNEVDISTWNEKERDTNFNLVYGDEQCSYSDFLCRLKEEVRTETKQKLADVT